MHAAAEMACTWSEHLLAVVGDVDDDCLILPESLHYLPYHRVVVPYGIIVVGHHLPALRRHIHIVRVRVSTPALLGVRAPYPVAHVLAHQVEDEEVRVNVNVPVPVNTVIVAKQSLVEDVKLRVSHVKLLLGERLVVDEESAREVIHRLLGLRQELIGEECHPVARLAEELAEERIVAPVRRVAHAVGGHQVLEYEARQVPRRYGVVHLGQQSRALQLHLLRHVLLVVAVELRMALIETLAQDKHYRRALHVTRVHLRPVERLEELIQLACYQLVAAYGKSQSHRRLVHLRMRSVGQRMLHGADGLHRHRLLVQPLVLPCTEIRRCHEGSEDKEIDHEAQHL